MNLPPDLVIELMDEADLETVAALEQASFHDPWPLQSFYTELKSNPLAVYLVARAGEKLIAYLGAWFILDEIHITTLAVAENYRRCGIATYLIEALVEKAGPKRAHCLTLEVRPSNITARSFYEKLGLKIKGRRKDYYSDEDALIMTKIDLFPRKEPEGGGSHES